MPTYAWQKSSHCGQGESCVHVLATPQKSSPCQEGDACVHISATPETIHITESADPTQAILDAAPSAFSALLHALRDRAPLTYTVSTER
ncbi:DUF397 domain-containing protein [Streptomyces sp. NPDC002643]